MSGISLLVSEINSIFVANWLIQTKLRNALIVMSLVILLITRIIVIRDCLRVTHNYFINFIEGLFPHVSEAQCGYTSLHKYHDTILTNLNRILLILDLKKFTEEHLSSEHDIIICGTKIDHFIVIYFSNSTVMHFNKLVLSLPGLWQSSKVCQNDSATLKLHFLEGILSMVVIEWQITATV